MEKVLTVFRSGGDFSPRHVRAMQAQVQRWAPPGTVFQCLSDTPIADVDTIPLERNWPGWWAKMEMFRPDIKGDFIYTDLDNVILGPLDDILAADTVVFNTGVRDTAWTALMALPEHVRWKVWDQFSRAPQTLMDWYDPNRAGPPFGDAGVVSACLHEYDERWEDMLPGQVRNISTMMTPLGFRVPAPKPRIVLCHRPHRPWTLPLFKSLYEDLLFKTPRAEVICQSSY